MINRKIVIRKVERLVSDHGYPVDDLGIYWFEKMVVEVVDKLENVDRNDYDLIVGDVISSLKHDYLDVCKFIDKSLEKTIPSEINYRLVDQIYGGSSIKMNCFKRAFVLGSYISGQLRQDNVSKVKTRVLNYGYKK